MTQQQAPSLGQCILWQSTLESKPDVRGKLTICLMDGKLMTSYGGSGRLMRTGCIDVYKQNFILHCTCFAWFTLLTYLLSIMSAGILDSNRGLPLLSVLDQTLIVPQMWFSVFSAPSTVWFQVFLSHPLFLLPSEVQWSAVHVIMPGSLLSTSLLWALHLLMMMVLNAILMICSLRFFLLDGIWPKV